MIDGEELRKRAEGLAGEGQPTDPAQAAGPTHEETRRILHDLRVHQIELEIQNEELRRAEVDRDAALARYFDLYDLAPVGYCTVSDRGLITQSNLTAATLLGASRSTLQMQSLARFVIPEDAASLYLHYKELARTRAPGSCELRMIGPGALPFWARLESTLVDGEKEGWVYRIVLVDISERKRNEEALAAALAGKELLLKEIHHRINNNMNGICGLLTLQSLNSGDMSAAEALAGAAERVQSMKVLSDKLFASGGFGAISLRDYMPDLVTAIIAGFPCAFAPVVETDIPDIVFEPRLLEPLGLIVNEALTNAMKHAFVGRTEGRIRVAAHRTGTNIVLAIEDDGIGLPEGVDCTSSSGFGLGLVDALATQLGGSVRIEGLGGSGLRAAAFAKDSGKAKGTRVLLEFPF